MKITVKVNSKGWSLSTKRRFEKAVRATAKQVADALHAEPERFDDGQAEKDN